jgi:3-oxoacyl-[acyl-carrier protein] reductase
VTEPQPGTSPTARLDGRVVILTGAAGGLGVLTARALLRDGARVIANHRKPSVELDELRAVYPSTLRLVKGDISEEQTAITLTGAARAWGGPHAVIHNAAIARDMPLVTMSADDWDQVQRTNLRGAFLITKHALRLMMRARYGRLVYLSSLAAVIGNQGQASYAASKAGLHGLANAVAQEYASYNVRTVVLAPGLLDAGLGDALDPDTRRRKAARSLLGIGSAAEVAATISFLASSDADYINATVIHHDGGIQY